MWPMFSASSSMVEQGLSFQGERIYEDVHELYN